ncbi:MAG: hypothetical protein BHV72_11785 [Bacteroides sp. 43_46]|uniref:PD-(D/E)XK nuclease family transposase n=1 Tax=Bacteroides sp. 43_46 TaxID=1897051 RepID=UPI0009600453|nr:PD-(D/E)XK nuclease family transposase [Bacteroides sp. 43_46]OKZ16838.1 MAG: hypothetical protein BHV72_11785 [Bacteroides sp. 43_46]
MGRFINPFTDYGFKFLFGREVEKELFRLDAVYGVFFMNFVMDKDMPATIRTDVVLSDRATGKLFNDKFRQIFIELPNFNKEEDECNTDFERWILLKRRGCRGMQKGMQKEKEVTARIMKSKGLSLELISECTGLTTEEIDKLE